MRASSLRGHRDTQHDRGRSAVATAAADVDRAVPEPAIVHVQAWRAIEDAVGVGSPLGTREVHRERLVREAPRIAESEAESHEVGCGHVGLESSHVTARRLHVVPHEARASVERLDMHVAGGLLVELSEHLRRTLEQALGLRTDVAIGVVLEGRVDLPEHAEDVLRDDLVDLPALLGLLHALHGRSELRPDEETSVSVLRERELAPVLRCVAIATFRHVGHEDVLVKVIREFLDMTEVDAGEERLEDVPTLEGGLGRPPDRVGQVGPLAPLLLRRRAVVAGFHDDDPVRVFSSALLRSFFREQAVHEDPRTCSVVTTAEEIRVVARPLPLVGADSDG